MKTRYQLDLESRINILEMDMDANGYSKHVYIERNMLLDELKDELNEYLKMKGDLKRQEQKDERHNRAKRE